MCIRTANDISRMYGPYFFQNFYMQIAERMLAIKFFEFLSLIYVTDYIYYVSWRKKNYHNEERMYLQQITT